MLSMVAFAVVGTIVLLSMTKPSFLLNESASAGGNFRVYSLPQSLMTFKSHEESAAD